MDSKGVRNFEVRHLPIGPFGVNEELAIATKETGGYALMGEGCVVKVSSDRRIVGGLHREIVMRSPPPLYLIGMTGRACVAADIIR